MNESEWWFEDEYDLELEPDYEYEPMDYDEPDPLSELEYLPSGLVVPKSEEDEPVVDTTSPAPAPTHLTIEVLDKAIADIKTQGSIPYHDLFLHPEIWKKLKEQSEASKMLINYDVAQLELKVAAATPEIFEEIYGKQQPAEESWVVPDWD